MGKMVSRWIANDGQEFVEQRDMLLHELSLIDAKEIELFVRDKPPRKQAEYGTLLKEWQLYQRTQQLDEMTPVNGILEDNHVPMLGIPENPFREDLDPFVDLENDDPFANATLI